LLVGILFACSQTLCLCFLHSRCQQFRILVGPHQANKDMGALPTHLKMQVSEALQT